MYFVAYIMPLAVTAVLLAMRLDFDHWWLYLIMLTVAELILWMFRNIFKKHTAKEFISAYVTAVHHEFPWVEKRERQERVQDSNGNSHTETRIEYIHHPDSWHWELNNGTCQAIDDELFDYWCDAFDTGVHFEHVYHHNCVRGGNGECCLWDGDPYNTQTVTYKRKYYNPIRYSHSIFKTEFISKKQAQTLGLYDYPDIDDCDQEVVLDRDGLLADNVAEAVQKEFQLLNAFEGDDHEIHVFVLLFDATKHSLAVVEEQRNYWFNGNKNEFVVCLGVEGNEVKWSNTFSWMDFETPTLGIATNQYFLEHTELDLLKFVGWLKANITLWKRKEAKDFKYLGVNLSPKQTSGFFAISAALSGIIVWITLQFIPIQPYF